MLRSNRSQRSNRCFTIFSDPIAVDSLSEIIFLCDRIAVSDPIAVSNGFQRSNRCRLIFGDYFVCLFMHFTQDARWHTMTIVALTGIFRGLLAT